MSNENLVNNVEWKKEQETDLLFHPQVQKVKFDGKPTKWNILYRTIPLNDPENFGASRRVCFSCMSDNYALVSNPLIDRSLRSFPDLNLNLNLELSTNRNNERFQLVYDVETNQEFDDGSDASGKGLDPKLVVLNSYNGSTRLVFEFGFYRFICSNMIVIPEVGKTFSMNVKHYKGNFQMELNKQIHQILSKILNQEIFDSIRSKITNNIESKEAMINVDFFKKLPYKHLFCFLGLVQKYAQMEVLATDPKKQRMYDIRTKEGSNILVEDVVNAKREDTESTYKVHWKEKIEKAAELEYAEHVATRWALFNLFIKMVQTTTEKHNRLSLTRLAGRYLLS